MQQQPKVIVSDNPTKRTSLTAKVHGQDVTVHGTSIRDCMAQITKLKNGII